MDQNNAQPEDRDDVPPFGQSPDFDELLTFLQDQVPDFEDLLGALSSGVQRDEKAHDAQMEKVLPHLQAAMTECDQEQVASESPEAETLAWGLWRSNCGCLHLSVPDGRGGWATNVEEVEPEKLLEVINGMVRGLGEAGLTMLRALASTEEGV